MKGLEPSTFCMASRRSSQLSYIRERAIIAAGLEPRPCALVASRGGRRQQPRRREARSGSRDPPRAGDRRLGDPRARDVPDERSEPRPRRRHLLRVAGRVPRLGDGRAPGDRRPLRRSVGARARRVRRRRGLRREHPPRAPRRARAARPRIDRDQLLRERRGGGRSHARALADPPSRRSPTRRTRSGSSRPSGSSARSGEGSRPARSSGSARRSGRPRRSSTP